MAGIAVAGGIISTKRANASDAMGVADNYRASEAEVKANTLRKHQSSLETDRYKTELAIQQYNMTRDLSTLESEQVAMASAMGKRAEGGSFERVQDTQKKDLAMNKDRMSSAMANADAMNALTHSSLDLSSKAIRDSAKSYDRANKYNAKTRKIGTITSGLMSIAKIF